MRPSGRAPGELRKVSLEPGYAPNAEGSCLVRFGDTHVLCAATVQERVPPFLRNTGRGWVTAEYGMLPRATSTRTDREAARGMSPFSNFGRITSSNPPIDQAGMVVVRLDPSGRLLSFRAEPPAFPDSKGPWAEPEWVPLFVASGLTISVALSSASSGLITM